MAKKYPVKKPVKKSTVKPRPKPKPRPKKKDEGCFITTACVQYYGLNDNCYELTTLRRFRDEYLLSNSSRKQTVLQYYVIAPTIVELLNNSKDKKEQYEEIYKSIRSACEAIEDGNMENAKKIYTDAVKTLCVKYNLI